MQNPCAFLLLILVAGLESCSSDTAKQAAQRPATNPTDVSHKAIADTMASQALESRHASNAKAGKTGQYTVPYPALPTAETSHPKAIRRSSTAFADAAEVEEYPEEVVLTDSVSSQELRRFLASGLPPAQHFTVWAGRDTMLVGKQGTQLLIPAGAWKIPDGTPVQLQLQEFYDLADIVLAGLSTTSGPSLLETGGMLHVTATTNGQPVQLRSGAFVHLRMPAKEVQPGMQLFEGAAGSPAHGIDWQLPATKRTVATTSPAHASQALRNRGRGPKKPRVQRVREWDSDSAGITHPRMNWPDYEDFTQDLRVQLVVPASRRRKQRRNRNNTVKQNFILDNLSEQFNQRIVRSAVVKFTIDSAGMIRKPVLASGSDLELGTATSTALLKLNRWKPTELPTYQKGKIGFERIDAVGHVQVIMGKSGRLSIMSPSSWGLTPAGRSRAKRAKHALDSLLALTGPRKHYYHLLDSLNKSLISKEQVRAQLELARLRTQFTDTSRAAITQAGVYNELSAQGLQWINCDRFSKQQPLITFKVSAPEQGTVTNLVFSGMRSVMRGQQEVASDAVFTNVPLGRIASVVALRRAKNVTYLAIRKTPITRSKLWGLDFHPVTMAELRAELAAL